jgi:hypothetical protein
LAAANGNGHRFGHHCCWQTSQIREHAEVNRNFSNNYFNSLILPKFFESSLGTNMSKAAHHSDGVDSLNPRRWRGKQLHHHGGSVCWFFALLWMDS